ncbi:MAG TPA: adenylate/guanylate cyclase domain-containing protein [Vicinamibacterales bacterium]|nr:adenylate/guanylate cyclase domain-containing protein [Vicinamibacterales bacterium]
MKAKSSVDRRIYLIAVGVVVLVFALYLWAPTFLKTVENKLYDLHFTLRGVRPPGDQVVIVAVDENSLSSLGRWPWPRSMLARIVRTLNEAGARVIAIDILLSEPEINREREVVTRLTERFDAVGLGRATTAGRALTAESDHLAQLDSDRQLTQAITESGRVILPMVFDLKTGMSDAAQELSGPPLKSALTRFRRYNERGSYPPPQAERATAPIPQFSDAAQALGHVTMIADRDGTTRWEALVFDYRGSYYPSLAVQAVRLFLGAEPTAVQLDFGRALAVGPVEIPVDPRNRMLIDWIGPPSTFRTVSAMDLLAGKVAAASLQGRIVFIGTTAAGTYDLRVTPMSPVFPGVEKHATVAANVLSRRFLQRPDWVELLEAGGIVLWPLLLTWVLPRFRPVASLGVIAALWVALYGAVHLAFLRGLWLPLVYPTLAMALALVGITVYRLLTEERQRLWTKRAFQQFVSPEVVERLVNNPAELKFGGEVRNLTVLFSDIRDFTTYTEQHQPEEVVQMLREYLTRMVDQVLAQQGTLDKFIGDAVMAIFGAPVALPDHAERACRAALGMIKEVQALQEKWVAEGREPFRIGIGINTGDMVVGNLGSEQLFDYTVIGDGVNIGARLESLNKEYKTSTHIIISETTYQAARGAIDVRRLGEVMVKGKTRPIVVYELLGLRMSTVTESVAAELTSVAART